MKNWKRRGLTMLAGAAVLLMAGKLDASAAGVRDVFDASYYAATYADVEAAFGNDEEALFQHYMSCGIVEGRDTSAVLNLTEYRNGYADLQAAFGDNWDAYADHYLMAGIAEGRTCGVKSGAASQQNTGAAGAAITTLEQWTVSEECQNVKQMLKEVTESGGMLVEIKADGNTLVYEYTLEPEVWNGVTAAELKMYFDAYDFNFYIEAQRGLCELLSQQFKEVYGIQLDGVRFVFIAPDGIPFYSGEMKIN